ncbi:hypothetical protein KV580_05810 [Pseudomonas chlororaphis]|nr:hypothetical protein [Pseudomonas chlororaphis]
MPAFDLPLIHLPFASRINPHQDEATRASNAWLESMGLVNRDVRRTLDSGRFFELAARVYPDAQAPGLQQMINLITWIFLLDDELDQGLLKDRVPEAQALLERLFGQFSVPRTAPAPKPGIEQSGCVLFASISEGLSPHGRRRFLQDLRDYFDSTLKEIEARAAGETPDLLAFVQVRRYTGATQLMFSGGEAANQAEVPDGFCRSRIFQALQDSANDVVVLVNDIFSFGKESHGGEINNYVVVCQHHLGLSLREAMDFVNRLVASRVQTFEQARERLPSFIGQQRYSDTERKAIEQYIAMLESWMSGNLAWSLRTPRYHNLPVMQEPLQ